MKSCTNNGFDFILYATLVSFTLARNLEPAEQDLLGEFLQAVGYNLSIIASRCLDEEEIILPKPTIKPIIKK